MLKSGGIGLLLAVGIAVAAMLAPQAYAQQSRSDGPSIASQGYVTLDAARSKKKTAPRDRCQADFKYCVAQCKRKGRASDGCVEQCNVNEWWCQICGGVPC